MTPLGPARHPYRRASGSTGVHPNEDLVRRFYEAFDRRDNGWIKVELQPQRRDSQGSEERVMDQAVADTFPASDPTTMQNPR